MDVVPFGASADQVSRIGLGCSRLSPLSGSRLGVAKLVVSQALDRGINFFDTADSYGAGWGERWLGRALGSRRGHVMIATKCGQPATLGAKLFTRLPKTARSSSVAPTLPADQLFSPGHIRSSLVRSLRRLGTDYVDVLMLHSPPLSVLSDGSWAEAMSNLRDRGLIRYFGISARSPEDAALAIRNSHVDCIEIELNPCTSEASEPVLALAHEHGTAVIARQAYGSRSLLDTALSQLNNGDVARTRREVAAALLRFVLQMPDVSVVIVGMTRADHVSENTSPSMPAPEFVQRVVEAARRGCGPER